MIIKIDFRKFNMTSVAAQRQKIAGNLIIEEAFSAFLKELASELSAPAVANVKSVLDMLRHHLNTCASEQNSPKKCHQVLEPLALIEYLDPFLRYCVMREVVTTFEQQEFVFSVTYDFCEWMHKKSLLTDKDFAVFQRLKDMHLEMWKQAYIAAQKIESSLRRSKMVSDNKQIIDFGRHDIAKIQGNKVWLEIWSLPLLPVDDLVGPITLPKGVGATLQVGWMITCELANTKSGWRISDIGNIYPSLPFNI